MMKIITGLRKLVTVGKIMNRNGIPWDGDSPIEELIHTALKETSACFISGLSGKTEVTLHSLNVLDAVSEEHFVSNLTDAIEIAGTLLKSKSPA